MTPPDSIQTEPLLSIGAFSRLTRLSPKALRLYDALGLLSPAEVGPVSGYRSYRPAQVETARLISLLRQLDMPLARVAAVIALPGPDAAREVAAYWQGAEREFGTLRGLVQYLTGLLQGKEPHVYQIQSRDVPTQKVATIQRNVFVRDLSAVIGSAHARLGLLLARAGVRAGGPGFVVYHREVNQDSDGPVEVCLPFEGQLEPEAEVRLRLEPARRELYTTISKAQCAFPDILQAYDAVYRAATDQGLTPGLPPREVYSADWERAAGDQPVCDIALPVEQEGKAHV